MILSGYRLPKQLIVKNNRSVNYATRLSKSFVFIII